MTIRQSPATDCETLHRDAHDRNLISSILGELLNRVAALEAAAAPVPAPPAPDTRDPDCVQRWPDCYSGGYDSRCCRFPKSCSCGGFLAPRPVLITTAPAPQPEPAPDHLGDATDNGLLRCYAAAASEAIAHHQAGQQQAMQAGRRAIYDLGRRHGAAQAIQEAHRAAAELEGTDG